MPNDGADLPPTGGAGPPRANLCVVLPKRHRFLQRLRAVS